MRPVALGLGCRRNTPAAAIAALARAALARLSPPPGEVALFSSERKADEAGLAGAARELGYSLTFLSDAELAAVGERLVTRSAKVREVTGLDGVAEAAALAGAGPGARIVVARMTANGVACAIAAEPEGAP